MTADELPVSAHRGEILAALAHHPVVIVCGDTGSGKTTQLPKMALEAGCAAHGRRIACTQPRRLAAVTMAERVAAELQTAVGGLVGFQHRYGRKVSDETRIKFMTDGVLLSETRGDRMLRQYDCIIVDEAHERSLNVDFLLGILRRLLERRRDLKVIISSATMDVERFSAFFDHAPVIRVPGRLYPVETRYLAADSDERDLPRDVVAAVRSLPTEGDILVFLPGERDIRDCADALSAQFPRDEIIPLIASLPADEQRRAFRLSQSRRIILATNVAETSVTIPGIRAVIDSGLVRLSRYCHRTQVQRLQIEATSQASARQRQGRCGRVGPGICVRLYSEEDFLSRDEYTPPEILRTSLAGVILTTLELGLGDIARFPFLEPPRPSMIAEGYRELIELGAVARDDRGEPCLTAIGRQLARIPVEPRLARMLIEASRLATLPSAIPVVAAMSCDDPRRRPADEREKAQQSHATFRVPTSDFLGTLKLWTWWRDHSTALSQSKLRKLCKETYLSYPKMREWSELVRQLEHLAQRLGLDVTNDNGGADALHRALLTGLLGRLGKYFPEDREYRGARGLRFVLHPGSALAKGRQRTCPDWIMAGELVDTTRLYAREVTAINPIWIEAAAGNLARHHVHSPEWDGRSGFVRATEQVTLYGLVIVPARRCDYARFDPRGARDLFIRRGLIDCAIPRPPPAVRRNIALLDALRRQAEKLRRPELFDENALAAHFDTVLPPEVCNAPALARWLRAATPQEIARFELKKRDWWPSDHLGDSDYPDTIRIGNVKMRLTYRHSREDPETDGVTCSVRKSQAAALRLWRADWLVPGMLPEKLTWMLAVLPSAQRRVLTPIADYVAGLLAKLKPGTEPLEDAVLRTVYSEWGFRLSREAWRRAKLPPHLRVRFEIRDDQTGQPIAASRDMEEALKLAGVATAGNGVSTSSHDTQEKSTSWTFGDIPEKVADASAGWTLEHYPALHDDGDGVSLRLHAEAAEAARTHADGVRRLYLLALGGKALVRLRTRDLSLASQLYLKDLNYDADRLAADILAGAVQATLINALPPVRTAAIFAARLEERRAELLRAQAEIARLAATSLNEITRLLNLVETDPSVPPETAAAVQTQLVWLAAPGFPRTTPLVQLRHYARFLNGIGVRLQRARLGHAGDHAKEARFAPFWQRYRAALKDTSAAHPPRETLERYRWLLEEWRISLFAQELKTAEPVSEKRLDALLPR